MLLQTQPVARAQLRNAPIVHPLRPCKLAVGFGRSAGCKPAAFAVPHRSLRARTAVQEVVQTVADAPTTSEAATSSQTPVFDWNKQWYPVLPASYAEAGKPHGITLLDRQFVVWKDGSGTWRANEDFCPHRLAPLSEGRIEAGHLTCSYHGWRFNGEGQCTRVPQSETPKAQATACASSRSCLVTYPIKEEYGLLWLWPDASPTAPLESAAAAPAVSVALDQHYAAGGDVNWYMRDLPYGYDVLVENLNDPSHLPHSHHNLTPGLKRSTGNEMPFTNLVPAWTARQQQQQTNGAAAAAANASSNGGTAVKESTLAALEMTQPLSAAADPSGALAQACAFAFPSAMADDGIVVFNPPTTVVYRYSQGGEVRIQNELIATPHSPGKSRVFTAGFSRVGGSKPNPLELVANVFRPTIFKALLSRYILASLPKWQLHMFSNKLFDQDGIFLSMQDKILHSKRWGSDWKKAYYMPTSCDGAVIAARRWIDTIGGGGPPYDAWKAQQGAALSNGSASSRAPVQATGLNMPSSRQMLDRYSQHTQHCPVCKKGLEGLEKAVATLPYVGAALLVGLCALLGSAGGVPGVYGAAAAGWAKALGWGLVVGLAWCASKYSSAVKAIPGFYYVPFSHATNE